MTRWFKNFFGLLKEAGVEFGDDHATKLSASLAYFTIFSIGPLLLVIITILGFVYKKATVTTEIFERVSSVIGKSGASALHNILNNMSRQTHTTLIGTIGILVFIFGATTIFSEIQTSINYIWSVKAKPKRSWLKYIIDRLISLLLVVIMGFIMMITIVANVVIDLIAGRLHHLLGDAEIVLLKGANFGVLFLIVTLVFTIIFRVLPDARIHLKDAIVGAVFTSVLFLIGKFLISYYLGFAKSLNAYGAATSIILLLTWIYYCAMILYYGAEFTEVYAKKYGHGITVSKNAVHIFKHEAQIQTLKHQDSAPGKKGA